MYNYNTTRPPLLLQEYGRHIQQLIDDIKKIDNKNLRTQKANILIKLMGNINPNNGSTQKYWDDIFKISDYQLDIDGFSPKPIQPIKHSVMAVYAATEPIKYKHYGRYLTILLKKIVTLTSPKAQVEMLLIIGKLMRRFSSIWNNEFISNEKIIEDMQRMLSMHTAHELDLAVIRTLPDDGINSKKYKANYPTKTIAPTNKHKAK
ncbi:MAG: DUF4290 domain-containing protein [Candidatus Cardinium sp.]|nr:DUF4290 domain-containing protein [Candidatus Cardinium sp.]